MGQLPMKTNLDIDEELLAEAKHLTGITDRNELIHQGLRLLIERESAYRLSRLGGTEPNLQPVPRRRH